MQQYEFERALGLPVMGNRVSIGGAILTGK
jgi:hypothetical protein